MPPPVWIDCRSLADVGPPDELAARASGRHVVLRFTSLAPDEQAALIKRLAAALPDHSVFASDPHWVTVLPVVARSRVLERRVAVRRALAAYCQSCDVLVRHYRAGTLPPGWDAAEHGGQCRFTHRRTGQVVEAPFQVWDDPNCIDPYFFGLFVQTTPGLEQVAELITDTYHDAARLIAIMDGEP